MFFFYFDENSFDKSKVNEINNYTTLKPCTNREYTHTSSFSLFFSSTFCIANNSSKIVTINANVIHLYMERNTLSIPPSNGPTLSFAYRVEMNVQKRVTNKNTIFVPSKLSNDETSSIDFIFKRYFL